MSQGLTKDNRTVAFIVSTASRPLLPLCSIRTSNRTINTLLQYGDVAHWYINYILQALVQPSACGHL